MNPRNLLTYLRSPTGVFMSFVVLLIVAIVFLKGFYDPNKNKPQTVSPLSPGSTNQTAQTVQTVQREIAPFNPPREHHVQRGPGHDAELSTLGNRTCQVPGGNANSHSALNNLGVCHQNTSVRIVSANRRIANFITGNLRPIWYRGARMRTVIVGLICLAGTGSAMEPSNVSGFRGPDRNGIYPARPLLRTWPAEGPKLLWEARVASGWTAPSVAGGLIYFVGKTGAEGLVQAFSLDGQEVFNVGYGPEKPTELPRATPAIGAGRLFYESNLGILYCLDAKTGAKLWTADLNQHGDTSTRTGGVSASPLLYRDLVIVATRSTSDDVPSFVAFQAATGKFAWEGNLGPSPDPAKGWSNAHATPILVDTGRSTLVVNAFFRGIGAVNVDTGAKAWTIPFGKGSKLGAVQSVFNEGYLFLGGALMRKLQPDGTFQTLWESPAGQPEYNVSYSHTIIQAGRLITFTPPALKCLDAETGKLINSSPCGAQGSIIMADGMVILFDNRPKVALITVGKDGLTEGSSFKPPIGGGKNDNFCHPAVAEGRLILRKLERVVVYDLRAGK